MGSPEEKADEKPFLPPPATSAYVKRQKQHPPAIILLVVAFYWFISISVVFLNKYILSSSEYKFPYPLFVTWFQMVVALGPSWMNNTLYTLSRYKLFSLIPPYEFDLSIARKVAPLTLTYVMMLAFNNLCLQYVEVTFYQVARSLSIIFNIIFTYTLLGAKTTIPALFACIIVFFGFAIGSYGEINFSWQGIIYGVTSSAFVALYGIYVKKTLMVLEKNEWRLLHYNTTLSIILLLPMVLFSGEPEKIYMDAYFIDETGFWMLMIFTGITGFVINIAMFLQIKFTTPLTNTISGTAKSCFQTALAAWYFQNPISAMVMIAF
ncbi:2350_t:CDS:2 [Ambispora leptoticha]|uniref:2350_t:CDS:1 n=1 Tax=Ambispora leptoticha TaxID=144679 RepID=A0A9N9GLW4_9GLOM|nr:2350_t:CDS:2 [Ambispora leptoticha]